jgi:GTP-binding protein EngB required for normal cell division
MEENNLSWKVVARPQLETWSISTNHVPTVIIFGEPGVGKSSVVNLIFGEDTAPTSPNAERCTFSSTSYSATIQGKMYNLYDTSRINHGGTGTANIEAAKTILDLYNLVRFLDENEGPKLLVFVVRCGRLTETTKKNYDLFRDTIFEKMVPIVVVITGCENVIPMDHWWDDNKATFEEAGMTFSGHACVCTLRGRKKQIFNLKEKRFKESKAKVEGLIRMGCHFTGQKMVRTLFIWGSDLLIQHRNRFRGLKKSSKR